MNSGDPEIWTWLGPVADPLCNPCPSVPSLDCVILHVIQVRVEFDDCEVSSNARFLSCVPKLGREVVWGCLECWSLDHRVERG